MAGSIVSEDQAGPTPSPRQKKITVIVPVSEAVLDWLVSKKHLAAKERENDSAIKLAIESLLSASVRSAAL